MKPHVAAVIPVLAILGVGTCLATNSSASGARGSQRSTSYGTSSGYGTGSSDVYGGTSTTGSYSTTADSITGRIPKGYRGFAFPAEEGTAVGGWTLPGSQVDVIFTEPVRDHGTKTTTLFQNIHVIAGGGLGTKAVILQLTPEQVEQLSTALDTGHVRLSLRGSNEPNAPVSIAPDSTEREFIAQSK